MAMLGTRRKIPKLFSEYCIIYYGHFSNTQEYSTLDIIYLQLDIMAVEL